MVLQGLREVPLRAASWTALCSHGTCGPGDTMVVPRAAETPTVRPCVVCVSAFYPHNIKNKKLQKEKKVCGNTWPVISITETVSSGLVRNEVSSSAGVLVRDRENGQKRTQINLNIGSTVRLFQTISRIQEPKSNQISRNPSGDSSTHQALHLSWSLPEFALAPGSCLQWGRALS